MEQLTEALLSSSGWAALALGFTLPALEAPAFIGLVLPGELALLLGGVLAHQGRIPLAGALAVGVATAQRPRNKNPSTALPAASGPSRR